MKERLLYGISIILILIVGCNKDEGSEPVAIFAANHSSIKIDSIIQFTDLSNNNPTSWSWSFGDGGTSNKQNPSYAYSSFGMYTVSLSVANKYGSDIDIKPNYVSVIASRGSASLFIDDRDGKTYKTIEIGNQVWMAENLNYNTSSGSWDFRNDPSNSSVYGRLYDWNTAINVCPSGWHLPSDSEWMQLEKAIGMRNIDVENIGWRGSDEGNKLKATISWNYGNGTDEYGFTALSVGCRYNDLDGFDGDGYLCGFWASSTGKYPNRPYYRILNYYQGAIYRNDGRKDDGFSVRCVKD